MISFGFAALGQVVAPVCLGRLPLDASGVVFSDISSIDIDLAGNIYLLDRGRHQLFLISEEGKLEIQIGGFGSGDQQFNSPADLNASNGLDVFVADYQNERVMRFDKSLNFLSAFESRWEAPYHFNEVVCLAVSDLNDLFLIDNGEKKVLKFSRFSEPTAVFGGIFDTDGQLLDPVQITIDGSKHIYVSDPSQEAVIVFDYLGNFVTRIQSPDVPSPAGLHFGMDGRLYVADRDTPTIGVFSRKHLAINSYTLAVMQKNVVDMAIYYDKRSGKHILFAASAQKCFYYDISN